MPQFWILGLTHRKRKQRERAEKADRERAATEAGSKASDRVPVSVDITPFSPSAYSASVYTESSSQAPSGRPSTPASNSGYTNGNLGSRHHDNGHHVNGHHANRNASGLHITTNAGHTVVHHAVGTAKGPNSPISSVSISSQSVNGTPTSLFTDDMSPEALALNPLEDVTHDVVVVGAGPSGLLLAANLVRFGVRVEVVDNRSARTNTGRADGLQPKTIETLKQMRLADRLLLKGVKVFDIHFWRSGKTGKIERVARQPYYSPELDMRDPYLLLAHQGFVEDLFLKDMQERGLEVHRNLSFVDYTHDSGESPIHVLLKSETRPVRLTTRYLVGCDGVHSGVRTAMGARPVGSSYDAVWGVLDGLLETTFPDLYSMVIINHAENGSALLFPREKGMTRLYVELKRELRNGPSKKEFSREMVMARAAEIFEPYSIRWKHVEWFGLYQVGQKIASAFQDTNAKVFIAGDACHSQSPKASQGMNHSMHDSWNLAWKLNLAVRGLAKPALLASYDLERRQVADRLITFDFEHASTFVAGDMQALSANFRKNIKFISGYGAEYAPNALCVPQTQGEVRGLLRAGELPVPARVLRAFDRNPVDLQLDIPVLGQFRIFVFAPSPITPRPFLQALSSHMLSFNSPMGKLTCAANASYTTLPPLAAPSDEFIRPERYTTISGLFTFALVIPPQGEEFDVKDLPAAWRDSAFTVYFDDEAGSAAEKWLGGVEKGEVAVVVLRPDGYVGTVGRFDSRGCGIMEGKKAGEWLDEYFDGFLTAGY